MMLSGILSDTLNLQGPTTTDTDRMMVAALAKLAHVEDINELASFQFRAKSAALTAMTDTEILMGDHKVFKFTVDGDAFRVGFGVVECVGDAPAAMMRRKAGLIEEMVALKNSLDLRYSFFAVVDIVNLTSTLILCGLAEREVAEAAFGGAVNDDGTEMDLGSRVSRKKDFIKNGIDPVLTSGSFKLTPPALRLTRQQSDTPASPLVLDTHEGGCCGRVTRHNKLKNVAQAMIASMRLNKGHRHGADTSGSAADTCCAASGHGEGNARDGDGGGAAEVAAPTAGASGVWKLALVAVAAAAAGFVFGRRR